MMNRYVASGWRVPGFSCEGEPEPGFTELEFDPSILRLRQLYFTTSEHEEVSGGGGQAQGLRRPQLLQRHPSSWELDPGDQTPFEQATTRRPHSVQIEEYLLPNDQSQTSDQKNSKENESQKEQPPGELSIGKTAETFNSETELNSETLDNTPIQKKTPRHAPNLPRLKRIESEVDPLYREKRGSVTEQSFTLPSEQTKQNIEKSQLPNEASHIFNRIVLNLNRDSFLNKVLNPEQKLSFPSEDDQSKDDRSSKTSITSPESSSGEKEVNPRIWISKSVSKILEDKPKTTPAVSEKIRSKSPSGLFEFAQRRLPKWASFIKKSDEDSEISNKSQEQLDQSKDKKTASSESTEKAIKLSSCRPKSTEDEEVEVRRKGILRRVAIDDESERIDSERYPAPSTSVSNTKSPENGEARPALKSYSFSFFKSKDRKDVRTDGKLKSRLGDGSSLKSKDSDKSEASTPSLTVEPSDSWRKRASGNGPKQTSFDEKSKTFIKQKSKDYSGEPVRKNSINFGHLREKYNRWSKSCRNDGGKAASAETLEVSTGQREGYVQGEFLAASMRIFLVVSPPASRTQVRSRSLNNLDSLENKNTRLLESRLKSKMFFGTKTSIPGYFTSLPELTALNFTKGLPYKPGVTHGKSAFVRRNTAKLKHTNSQCNLKNYDPYTEIVININVQSTLEVPEELNCGKCKPPSEYPVSSSIHALTHKKGSTRDYFRLSLPSSFEFSESIEDKSPDLKKINQNSIFIPAVGNTTLRDAAQWALENEKLKQNQIITDFSIRIDGSSQYLQLESVDAGQLAGRHVILQDTRKLRNIFRKSSIGLKSSSKLSSPASNHSKSFQDPKTPLALKLQKWSSIFGSKADALMMERLMVKLEQMNFVRPKLPPNLRLLSLPEASAKLMISVQDMQLEDIMDPTDFDDQKELRRQRIIFELISTEAAYICNIRTIVEVFLAVALALQKENILVEIDVDKIFLNLPELLNINLHFWNETLYPMLAEAGVKRFNPQALYDIFHNFRGIFHPYSEYVENQGRIQVYTRHLVETNPIYTAYLTWCESQKECNRLKLSDLLVKPMQRLTKYSLLLKAIDSETDPGIDKCTLKTIILNCTKYISSVDRKIRYVQELDIMDALIENIESYDVVDSKDEDVEKVLKFHCDLNLKTKIPYYDPRFHRTVILQGELKFKDKEQKIEIRGVLLTDIFLICSTGSKRKKSHAIKVIRPQILMNRVYLYPQYVMKDGVKELNFLIAVVVDETDVAISYFCLYEPSNPKEPTNPTIKQWLFALRESQTTLSLTKKMLEEGRINMYDTDTQSESDADRRCVSQEVLLEPMEAIQPSVNKAAKKRISTMVYGANLPIEQYPPEGVEVRDDFTRPCSSRASRMSSLHQSSYSGSYDTYEVGTSAQATGTRAGSADTSTDHRTISMSSDEGLPPLVITSEQHQTVQHAVEASTSKTPSAGRGRGTYRAPPICTPRIAPAVPTPNTLSVHITHANLGQSMPDLASGQISPAQSSYGQSPNKVSLNVPSRNKYLKPTQGQGSAGKSSKSSEKLSPESRGISYPPSSPTRFRRMTPSVFRGVTSRGQDDACKIFRGKMPVVSELDASSVELDACSVESKRFYLKPPTLRLPSPPRVSQASLVSLMNTVKASLRRGMAFSNTIKNPPLVKSRNISRDSSPCVPPPPNSSNPSPSKIPLPSAAACLPSTSTGYSGCEYTRQHYLKIPQSSDSSPSSNNHQSSSDA